MARQEKIGRASMREEGANVEIGQPVLKEEFEKESVEATLDAVKEALEEFYRYRSNHDQQAAFALQAMRDPMRPHTVSVEEIKKKDGDMTIPLAVLESALGEIQQERDLIEAREPDAEEVEMNERAEEARQADFKKEMHYQEAADVLFAYAGFEVPTHGDLLEWLEEAKIHMKKSAKREEDHYQGAEPGAGTSRIFRSRLLTDVPAIERYESGRQTTQDYREVMGVVEEQLLNHREIVGTFLLQYANDPKKGFISELQRQLGEVRKLELFLSRLEGERNERIAGEKP